MQTNSDMGWILYEYCHAYFIPGTDHKCPLYDDLILSGISIEEQRLLDIEKSIKKLQEELNRLKKEVMSGNYRSIRRMGE